MMEKQGLEERLGRVIRNTCNTIGCKNCGLSHSDGCAATDLQDQIMAIEYTEIMQEDK